jgi:radical SAM superfamily enzyme YgiQ (UPF0313 family)
MDNRPTVLLAAVNSRYIHSNLAFLYLEKLSCGLPCQVIRKDWSINVPQRQLLYNICHLRPQIISFSVYIWNREYVQALCSDLRQLLPDALIVLGGPEASACPRYFLEQDLCQVVIVGEGEASWRAFLADWLQGKKTDCPGVLWQGQENFQKAELCHMDDLPFPYTEEYLSQLRDRIIYYESSRGCPYSCSFCASGQDKLRFRSLEKVADDLRFLAAHRQGQIKFVDRTFNADRKRAALICRLLLELYRPGLSWHFELSPFLLDQELTDLLQSAPTGYIQLEIGVQSLDAKVLAAVYRSGDWSRSQEHVRKLLAADNCHIHLDLVAGLPLEELDSIKKAFNCLHNIYPHHLQLGFLKVLPGSRLEAEAQNLGIAFSRRPPYQVLYTPDMSAEELFRLEKVAHAVDDFYNPGRFRQTLYLAADEWPGGAMELYEHLAKLEERRFDGSLNMHKRVQILAELLLQGKKRELYFDLLRLDWLLYGKGEPLPKFLRLANDKKTAAGMEADFSHHFSWQQSGLISWQDGRCRMSFDYNRLQGVSKAALFKEITLVTGSNL